MRTVRAALGSDIFYGVLEDGIVRRLSHAPFDGIEYTGNEYEEKTLKLLNPAEPSKIVAIGKNYHAHALEMNEGEPTEPLLFLKPSTSVISPEDMVVYPAISKRLDYEGELCVVIGRRCRNVKSEDALNYVFGYTCLNDVTARDIQKSDPQWTRGKGFDTFCPIGPCIVTDLDASDLAIQTRLNGKIVQSSRTSYMTHKIPELIEYISRVMTLLPGDCIATGTPEGIGQMQIGDRVEVEIEGIGTLANTIAGEEIL